MRNIISLFQIIANSHISDFLRIDFVHFFARPKKRTKKRAACLLTDPLSLRALLASQTRPPEADSNRNAPGRFLQASGYPVCARLRQLTPVLNPSRKVQFFFLKRDNYFFVLGVAFLFLSSCQKVVDIKLSDQHESQLFVESILFVGEQPKVFLSQSLPFFNEKVTPQETFVRGAEVEIRTSDEVFLLQPDSTYDKFRCRWHPFYGGDFLVESGRVYELVIRYGNQEVRGQTSTDLRPVSIEDVEYTAEFFDVYGGHDGVIVRFKDTPGAGDNYRFQMDRWIDNTRFHAHVFDGFEIPCVEDGELFFVSDLGRSIFSDFEIDGTDFELYLEVSFEYLEGDSATIYMQTLDDNAASFYQDLDKQLESIQNPFVEPAFLHSTVEGGFGVFGAGIRSEPWYFEYPQDNP